MLCPSPGPRRWLSLPLLGLGLSTASAQVLLAPLSTRVIDLNAPSKSVVVEQRDPRVQALPPTPQEPTASRTEPAPAALARSIPTTVKPSIAPARPARKPATSARRASSQGRTPSSRPASSPTPRPAANRPIAIDPVDAYNRDVVQPATVALLNEKNPERAFKILKAAEEDIARYDDYGTMVLLGLAAMQVGDEDTALKHLRKAAEDTEDPPFQQALASALVRFDRLDEAQRLLDAMEDSPERRETRQLLVQRRVIKAIETERFADAERLLLEQPGPLDAEGQELLAWTQYRQGKMAEAVKGFAEAYRKTPSKGAASGLVLSTHAQKNYPVLLAMAQQSPGPLRDLVPAAVQQKIAQGETRFTVGSDGRLAEVDPVLIFNNDIVQPATVALLNEKNPKKAYDLLAPVEANLIENADFGNLALLGMAATEVGDQTTALRVLKKAAEETEDEAFYRVWAQSLIRFDRVEEAEQALLKQQEYLDANGLMVLGWAQFRLGKHALAAERFAAAYAKEPSEGAAQGLVYSAHQAKRYPLILTSLNKHPDGPLGPLVAPDIRTRLAAGEDRFGVDGQARLVVQRGNAPSGPREWLSLKVEPHLRGKAGTAGEGKLRQAGVVGTLRWQGSSQQVTLEVERQRASDAVDRASGQRWYALWNLQTASDIGFRLGVGRTLGGGAVRPTTVGEVGVGYHVPDGGVGVRLFRRGNEESLLALAGTPEALTGLRWGRVLERGLAIDAYHRGGSWDMLGSLVFSSLEGQTVAANRKVELYARALRPMESVPGLSLGPELYISRFGRNLSAFEPGHGGYFSPSLSVKLGALGRYETSLGSLALTLTGGLGWGHNREAAAAGHPITGARPGQYPAATGRGLAYHGRIEGLWPLSPNWHLGFGMGMQRSPYFSDWRASVFAQRRWLE